MLILFYAKLNLRKLLRVRVKCMKYLRTSPASNLDRAEYNFSKQSCELRFTCFVNDNFLKTCFECIRKPSQPAQESDSIGVNSGKSSQISSSSASPGGTCEKINYLVKPQPFQTQKCFDSSASSTFTQDRSWIHHR